MFVGWRRILQLKKKSRKTTTSGLVLTGLSLSLGMASMASGGKTGSNGGEGGAFSRLENFRRHAITVISNPDLLSDEFQKAKIYAEGQPGYKTRITESLPHIRSKNRYFNIVTLDDTRVHLKDDIDNGGDDYINASFIYGNETQKENDIAPYIATQGPMTSTSFDFWRMCLQQKSSIILMLSPFVEGGRQKVDPYFPTKPGETQIFEHDPETKKVLTVTCMSQEAIQVDKDEDSLILRSFEIEFDEKKSIIRHFHFIAWPDFGNVHETPTLLSLIEIIEKAVEESDRKKKQTGPLITHCSAGVGRTGTFLAIDVIRRNVKLNPNYEIDVRKVVSDLRNQRPQMVMTVEQYAMIYRAIFLWLFDEDLTPNIKNKTKILADEDMYKNGLKY